MSSKRKQKAKRHNKRLVKDKLVSEKNYGKHEEYKAIKSHAKTCNTFLVSISEVEASRMVTRNHKAVTTVKAEPELLNAYSKPKFGVIIKRPYKKVYSIS